MISNPANQRGVLGDDEDAKVVGPGIRRHEEEANLLGIVGVRCAYKFFAIAKSDFGFSAAILRGQNLGFRVFTVADKILGEEDGLQILQLYVRAFALGRVLLEKKTKAVLLGREIVNVAFETAAIEECHYRLIPVV